MIRKMILFYTDLTRSKASSWSHRMHSQTRQLLVKEL
jgi:hypothetical protein